MRCSQVFDLTAQRISEDVAERTPTHPKDTPRSLRSGSWVGPGQAVLSSCHRREWSLPGVGSGPDSHRGSHRSAHSPEGHPRAADDASSVCLLLAQLFLRPRAGTQGHISRPSERWTRRSEPAVSPAWLSLSPAGPVTSRPAARLKPQAPGRLRVLLGSGRYSPPHRGRRCMQSPGDRVSEHRPYLRQPRPGDQRTAAACVEPSQG